MAALSNAYSQRTNTALDGHMHAAIEHYREHPVDFVQDVFGATPDEWQGDALNALVDHQRVSIRACHGVGKTTVDAWAINWFLATHYPARVPCTAPTATQLRDVLWAELAKWHRAMVPQWRGSFRWLNQRYELVGARELRGSAYLITR